MHGQKIDYIRVSSSDQNTERQLDGLMLDRTVSIPHLWWGILTLKMGGPWLPFCLLASPRPFAPLVIVSVAHQACS